MRRSIPRAAMTGIVGTGLAMSVREIVALLFREIKIVLFAVFIPILVALLLFVMTPKQYEATAKILVTGQEASSQSTSPQSNDNGPQTTAQEVLNSEVEFLTSRELADRTITTVGSTRLFPKLKPGGSSLTPDTDAQYAAFVRSLQVKAVASSHIIDVSFKGPSPSIAVETLATYLKIYDQIHKEAYIKPVANLLSQHLQGDETDLRHVEAKIADFKEKNDIFDPDLERKNLLDTRNNLGSSAIQLKSQAKEFKSRVVALEKVRAQTPDTLPLYPEAADSDAMQKARAQLLDLQQQKTKLSQNYQPSSRTLQDVRAQIDGVQSFLSSETRRYSAQRRPSRNPLYDELTAEIARAKAQIAPAEDQAGAIAAQITKLDQRLQQIEEAQKILDPLQRERASDVSTVEAFRQRESEARLSEYVDHQKIANIR